MSLTKLAVAVAMILSATLALGADTPADIDLRLAAKLHKSGATGAAIGIWQKWAQQGNADAAYNLGIIHQYADGVAYDAATAMRWYRVAAEQGDKVSQFQIGLMYQNGEGVAADQGKAHEWFTRHRREHVHHHHSAQHVQWQQQALALIEARERRETAANSKRDGAIILAELKRRAALVAETLAETVVAVAKPRTTLH